jgi:3-methyladenine DNA glycosylase/8-oxoguanine DNA glycosylase
MARANSLPSSIELRRAARALAKKDRVMASLIDDHGPPKLDFLPHASFTALARAIVFQQLAGNAARAIWGRVEGVVGRPFTAARVLTLDDATLRGAGLSMAKLVALRDLAAKVDDGSVKLARLSRMADDDVVEALVQVRGIGRWTAEMFLLFKLGRSDVWPVTDFGVQKGYMLAYGLREMPKPRALAELGEPFRGQRSIAAWYLWRRAEVG